MIILYILSYFVAKGNMICVNISTILGVISPIMYAATPQNDSVLSQIANGGLISLLGVLQLLGFYIFPISYVVLRVAFRSKLSM